MKVVFTQNIPGPAFDLLRACGYEVQLPQNDHQTRLELLSLIKDSDAILSLLTDKVDAQFLDSAGKQLKIVANYAIGFDNIDLKEAEKRGIVVTNTPSQTITDAVAEHTFALMVDLAKRIKEADKFVREDLYHGWNPNLLIGTQLLGKKLGIIGLGRIGSVVARIAVKGMGMKVFYTGPSPKEDFEKEFGAEFKTLDQLLSESDFVTLHVPLTPQTTHLINAEKLSLMKKTAYVINTARGPVIDEQALTLSLREGKIAGAGLDVFESEDHITESLRSLDNVILTPHIASATKEARDDMSRIAAENIIAVLSGKKPLNPAFISS